MTTKIELVAPINMPVMVEVTSTIYIHCETSDIPDNPFPLVSLESQRNTDACYHLGKLLKAKA